MILKYYCRLVIKDNFIGSLYLMHLMYESYRPIGTEGYYNLRNLNMNNPPSYYKVPLMAMVIHFMYNISLFIEHL